MFAEEDQKAVYWVALEAQVCEDEYSRPSEQFSPFCIFLSSTNCCL